MPDFLLALFFVVLMLIVASAFLRLVVSVDGPLWSAGRRLRIDATVRREASDLDRRYEELLRL